MTELLAYELVHEGLREDAGDDVRDEAVHGALAAKVEIEQQFAVSVGGVELRRIDRLLVLVPVMGHVGLPERLLAIADARRRTMSHGPQVALQPQVL